VRALLVVSGLSARQQTLSIINALGGAARRSFFRAYNLDVNNATPDDVLDKLVALVPDHKAMFTQRAIDMTFSMTTLRDDIETFGLLVQHGEMCADGSHFWYKQLIQNLLAVRSDILTLSQNFLNEHRCLERILTASATTAVRCPMRPLPNDSIAVASVHATSLTLPLVPRM